MIARIKAKMSKILYTASTISHINNFHRPYIDALRSEGHTVLVMANGEGADFNIPFEKKILSSKNKLCRKHIRAILLKEDFDAIILNTTLAAFHIRLAIPKKSRARVVNVVHGYLFSRHTSLLKRKIFLLCERLLAKKTDSVIVMNGEDFDVALKNKLSLGKVYMSRGMGAPRRPALPESVKAERERGGSEYVISFVGELSQRKNQAFLISSLPHIRNIAGDVSLWLIGDGGERENLERLALSLGVAEKVRFFGRVPNPCDFIAASDLYVSASVIEGMPFNILEALSVGASLVISNVKGHRDVVTSGENGILYTFGDREEFVKSVCSCLLGKTVLDAEKISSAYEKYSFDSVFSETLNLIKESIGI